MRETTTVLLLGVEEWRNAVNQALPLGQKYVFQAADNYWSLCALPQGVAVDGVFESPAFGKTKCTSHVFQVFPLGRYGPTAGKSLGASFREFTGHAEDKNG
jgi:hypothetical protein